jgi:hypothetical protein
MDGAVLAAIRTNRMTTATALFHLNIEMIIAAKRDDASRHNPTRSTMASDATVDPQPGEDVVSDEAVISFWSWSLVQPVELM